MNAKLLVFCLPMLSGCGGVVDLGPVEKGAPPIVAEFEPTLVAFAPWGRGKCALFSDERIRCWRYFEDVAWTLPNLTGLAIHAGTTVDSGRICAVQRSGRVACITDTCGHRYADDESPEGCGLEYAEPYEIAGLERARGLTGESPGVALLADGRMQHLYDPFGPCPLGFPGPGAPNCFTAAPPFDAGEPIVAAYGIGDFATESGAAHSTSVHYDPAVIERVVAPNDYGSHTFPPLRVPGIEDALQIKGDYILHRSGKITAFGWVSCRGPESGLAQPGNARVECLDDAVALESNGLGTCAIRSDGSLWCWGISLSGELGVIEKVPTVYPPLYADYAVTLHAPYRLNVDSVRAVGIGGMTCAVRGKNEVTCWGFRGVTTEPSTTPRPVQFH